MLSWRSKPPDGLMYATARDVTDAARRRRGAARGQGTARARVEQRTRELAAANESLRKSERRFRALIEHGSDSIAMIDADSRIIYLSPAVANVEGYQPEELLGRLGTDTHAPRRSAGRRRQPSRSCSRIPASPIPADLAPPPQGRPLDLARGCRHQPAGRPVGGRHRHQLPRHHRAAGARIAARRADAAPGADGAHHARHRRAPGPAQHLPGGGAQHRRRAAGGFLHASACTTWARTGSPSAASARAPNRWPPRST